MHGQSWHARRAYAAVVVLALTMALALVSGSAQATVVERGRYADSFAFAYDDCGFPVEVTGEFSGRYLIREGKHKQASAFFIHDKFRYREVHTNTDTGEWFLLRGNALFHEVKATRVAGSVFQFEAIEAGQPFVVEDSAGNVVLRDRGVIRHRILFDTHGDDQPGGTFLEYLGAEVRGPHPGFFADFCDIASDLIGS